MKFRHLLTVALLLLQAATIQAAREVSYARKGLTVTMKVDWTSSNYGTLEWQTSADNGATWTTLSNTDGPSCSFRMDNTVLCRAIVKGDPTCPDVVVEREVRPVSFLSNIKDITANSATMTLSRLDLGEAQVKEYGYASLVKGVGRSFEAWPRTKTGDALPEGSTVDIPVSGLEPSRNYAVIPYILTEDGSMIFGSQKDVTTKAGIAFDSEDWTIEKERLRIPFSIEGAENPSPKIFVGPDSSSLKEYSVTDKGDGHYQSGLIRGLKAGTEYLVVVKATVDGQETERSKTVKTWSDYSKVEVDQTVQPVKHHVVWDAEKQLTCFTPESDQVEYPRVCRAGDEKLLLTYHGGASDHWQNSYIRKSYDNGATWSDRQTVYQTGEEFLGSKYYRICNPEMTRLQNGWIILSVVANGNPETNENCKVLVCLSKDNGETWGDPVIVGRGRTWEPMVVQLPNGELELLVSSEASWWEVSHSDLKQEIMSARSTDNGQTWTSFTRASFKPNARDGMPVAVVMQGNKGVCFIEESVNGNVPPSIVRRDLSGTWNNSDWNGTDNSSRWSTALPSGAGAPYMIQLPTGEFLIMAHTGQTGSVWQTCRPQTIMADSSCKNFKYSSTPLNGSVLPSETGAYYNSFFLFDDHTVWLLFTRAKYSGTFRQNSDVMMLRGTIVDY